jgi:hypothetical protein
MNHSIGDGIIVLAIAGAIVAYFYFKHRERQKRLQIIHLERMAAMEKGIPLPELPQDPPREHHPPDQTILPILGIVLLTLSVGSMIALYLTWQVPSGMTIAPLPFAFLGVGLIAFHLLKGGPKD